MVENSDNSKERYHDNELNIGNMVDNGGSRKSTLATERAGPLAAFPNPKMHKAFPLSEALISKGERLIFSVSLYRVGKLTKLKIKSERSEKLEPQIFSVSFFFCSF